PESGQNTVWAKVSSVDGTEGGYTLTTWRTQNPNDDHPDSGGVFLPRRELAPRGQLFIPGRIEGPGDSDNFHIRVDQPGPVVVQVISLTEGMTPFFSRARHSSDPDQRTGTSGGGSGRGGQAFEMITNMLPADDNWLVIDVKAGGDSTQPFGDYVVHVWQPGSNTDLDADTVGIEASPILLSGSGNGSLPGAPNGNMVTPALDHEGDKDVFQVLAASDRPITFTVSGQDTFLTAFDASGHAIQTDHQGGSNGASQITLEAERGQLFYLQVTAYDGVRTGNYSIQVSQPTDDFPDAIDAGLAIDPRHLTGPVLWSWPENLEANERIAASDHTVPQIIADDFRGDGRPVAAVRWWGSYISDSSVKPDGTTGPFDISFYNSTVDRFPAEGPPLVTHTVAAQQTFVGRTIYGNNVYRYDAMLPEAFATQDQSVYFMAIDKPTGENWGWRDADGTIGVATVAAGKNGPWDNKSPGTPIYMAFELFTSAAPAIESVGDRDVFQVTSTGRGQFTVDVAAAINLESNWQSATTGTGTVDIAANENVVLFSDGNGALTDDNTASVEVPLSVSQELSFDINGVFGGSHNWGLIELSDGTNSLQLALEAPDSQLGDTSGVGANSNFALYGTGVWQRSGGAIYIAPFQEDITHHVSIRLESTQLVVTWDGQEIGRFASTLPSDTPLTLRGWTNAAQAPDRNARLELSNTTVDGVRLAAVETPITLDTMLRVYDSRGNLVAIDDDGGDIRNSSVTFNTFQDETYFIEVSGYNDQSVGAYRVTVQASEFPRAEFAGVYDDFADGTLDALKWRTALDGNGSVIESGGQVRISANGSGANNATNGADFVSRAS
ncbi:MAG: hypothetical protein H7X97_02605, partial [Opitutaceae bacterium]|nr:hypothetical protein [Verrucomicrobiales bacterium]